MKFAIGDIPRLIGAIPRLVYAADDAAYSLSFAQTTEQLMA